MQSVCLYLNLPYKELNVESIIYVLNFKVLTNAIQ